MKADHPLAQNLFDRLSRYTPSEGEKRKREPLEDFITESIAYFLITSEPFRQRFIDQILKMTLQNTAMEISTQAKVKDFDGRADLVLFLPFPEKKHIGIEVKRDAVFQPDQLPRLRVGFPFKAVLLAPESYCREHHREIAAANVDAAALEDVHAICAKLAQSESEPQRSFLQQFADFLASKGHERVTLTHHPMKIQSLADSAKLMDEWTRLLYKLREELGLKLASHRKPPIWEEDKKRWPDTSFYGVYGSDGTYIGFKIDHQDSVTCFYEENRFIADPHFPLLPQMERGDQGRVYYSLTAPYPSPESGDQSAELTRIFKDLQAKVRQAFSELEKPA